MNRNDIGSIAHLLARRTGVTDTAIIEKDARRWATMSASHRRKAAPSDLEVRQSVPTANNLQHTLKRHQDLVEAGRQAAEDGTPIGELQRSIREQSTHLDNFSKVSFSPERARKSELAAFAQIQNTHYSVVHRFTDGKPSGNLTYRGKAAYHRTNKIPSSFRPIAEEKEHNPGESSLKRAAEHFAGTTEDSPFVSVTAHVPSARRTTDDQLQGIMHGSPDQAGAPSSIRSWCRTMAYYAQTG